MSTNSKTTAYNFGAGLGLRYNAPGNFLFSGNLTYAKLRGKSGNDGLEDGFNTPEWIVNFSVEKENLFRNTGFNVTYRWQTGYYWQSFLVNGDVPAYQTLDAQVTQRFKRTSIKKLVEAIFLIITIIHSSAALLSVDFTTPRSPTI